MQRSHGSWTEASVLCRALYCRGGILLSSFQVTFHKHPPSIFPLLHLSLPTAQQRNSADETTRRGESQDLPGPPWHPIATRATFPGHGSSWQPPVPRGSTSGRRRVDVEGSTWRPDPLAFVGVTGERQKERKVTNERCWPFVGSPGYITKS